MRISRFPAWRLLAGLMIAAGAVWPQRSLAQNAGSQEAEAFQQFRKSRIEAERQSRANTEAAAAQGDPYAQMVQGRYLLADGKIDAGISMIRRAAAQNYSLAVDALAGIYLTGEYGIPIDFTQAHDYLWKAVALGSTSARNQLFDAYRQAGDEPWMQEVVSVFVRARTWDDINLYMGSWYLRFVPNGQEEGIRRLTACLAQGDTRAYVPLITHYLKSDKSGEVDEGWRLAKEADAKGVNETRVKLAGYFLSGDLKNVQKHIPEAIRLLESAANAGAETAVWMLTYHYQYGSTADPKRLRYWVDFGAQRKMLSIVSELGALYYDGKAGLPKDRNKAIQIWTDAARAGSASAAGKLQSHYKWDSPDPAKEQHWKKTYDQLQQQAGESRREL